MNAYRIMAVGQPGEPWSLEWDDALLRLINPAGRLVLEVPVAAAHRAVEIYELYVGDKVCFTEQKGACRFDPHPAAAAGLKSLVEPGLRADPGYVAGLRRAAAWDIPRGLSIFGIAGGLFALYCWWAFTAGDPPRGSWLWWVLASFGCLIHAVLLVLMALALAGLLASFSGLRKWCWYRRVERALRKGRTWHVEVDAAVPQTAEPVAVTEAPRMRCPRCESDEVDPAPPSWISPESGYRCRQCGVKLQSRDALFLNLVALVLGGSLFALMLYLVLGGEGDHRMPAGGFVLGVAGLVCTGYAVLQLARPLPRQDRQ